jgi:glycosyltransferase involved in cell wall biosynthesis
VGVLPPQVDVILPCLNEAEALGWVLQRLPPGVWPIVVDNGSTDGSAEIAREYSAQVVHAPQRGYGAACHAGLLAATASVVAVMDADASLNPQQLERVVAPVMAGAADLVIGSRCPINPAAFPGPCASRTGSCHGGCSGALACGWPISARCGRLVASRCWRCRFGTAGPATRPRPWYVPPTRAGE